MGWIRGNAPELQIPDPGSPDTGPTSYRGKKENYIDVMTVISMI